MSNALVAALRTAVQYVVALGVAAGGAWLLDKFGIAVDVEAATEVAFVVIFGFVVWLVNAAQNRWPWLSNLLGGPASYQ